MNKVTFYIPSRTKEGKFIYATQKDIAGYVAGIFAVKFGGSTVIEGTGYYEDSRKNMVVEPVKLVYSFYNDVEADYFERIATTIKKAMRQESFMFEINGEPRFL